MKLTNPFRHLGTALLVRRLIRSQERTANALEDIVLYLHTHDTQLGAPLDDDDTGVEVLHTTDRSTWEFEQADRIKSGQAWEG